MNDFIFYSRHITNLLFSPFLLIIFICLSVINSRKRTYKRINLGRPPPPFSVSINDAVIGNTSAALSVIRITTANYKSVTQHLVKITLFTKRDRYLKRAHKHPRMKYKGFQFLLLPLLYLFSGTPSVHTVLGTNHVFFKGHTSLDKTRQHKYVDTIINKLENDHNNTITNPLQTQFQKLRPYHHHRQREDYSRNLIVL